MWEVAAYCEWLVAASAVPRSRTGSKAQRVRKKDEEEDEEDDENDEEDGGDNMAT